MGGGVLTFEYPPFADSGRCRPAWDVVVDRFTGSNYFNPYHMHAGNQAGYPHLTSLWIELRDNRGNLVDIAGHSRLQANASITNGVSAAPASDADVGYFKGGFFNGSDTDVALRTAIATGALPLGSGTTASDKVCDMLGGDLLYMASMERKTAFGNGADPASWDSATLNGPRTTNIGIYVKSDYKDYTIATPGEINSRWVSSP